MIELNVTRLCTDHRVSDEKIEQWLHEDEKCHMDIDKKLTERDECSKESDYINDKVKEPKNKFLMNEKCSEKYKKCLDNHTDYITRNGYQEDEWNKNKNLYDELDVSKKYDHAILK